MNARIRRKKEKQRRLALGNTQFLMERTFKYARAYQKMYTGQQKTALQFLKEEGLLNEL